MRYFSLILLVLFSCLLFADEEERYEMEQRIKPFGAVHIQGSDLNKETKPATVQPQKQTRTGQEIYEQFCFVCHKEGVANAPKFQNAADWAPRIKEADSIEGLLKIAIQGKNVMPPKGTCQDCSEKELKDAIEYMLPKS